MEESNMYDEKATVGMQLRPRETSWGGQGDMVLLHRVAAGLLVATAVTKVASIALKFRAHPDLFTVPNPVFPFIPAAAFLLLAAAVELLLAGLLWRGRGRSWVTGLLGWFVSLAWWYRWLYSLALPGASCGCGGYWSASIQKAADHGSTVVLVFLTATAVAGWLARMAQRRADIRHPAGPGGTRAGTSPIRGMVMLASMLGSASLHGRSAEAYYEVRLEGGSSSYRSAPTSRQDASSTLQGRARKRSWTARVVFGGRFWLIESRFIPNAVQYHYCDGTNVYELVEFYPLPAELAAVYGQRYGAPPPGPAPGEEVPQYHVRVIPGTVPLDHSGVTLLWMAFCSPFHPLDWGSGIPLSADALADPDAFAYRTEVHRFEDRVGLPESVRFYKSSARLRVSANRPVRIRSSWSRKHLTSVLLREFRLEDGFLAAHYYVVAATNLDGIHIPLEFEMGFYRRVAGGAAELRGLDQGRVTLLTYCAAPQWPVKEVGRVQVDDHRFRHPRKLVDYISYFSEEGRIPPVSDPQLHRLFEQQAAAAPWDPALVQRLGNIGFWGLLAAPPAVAGTLWLIRKCTHRTATMKQGGRT